MGHPVDSKVMRTFDQKILLVTTISNICLFNVIYFNNIQKWLFKFKNNNYHGHSLQQHYCTIKQIIFRLLSWVYYGLVKCFLVCTYHVFIFELDLQLIGSGPDLQRWLIWARQTPKSSRFLITSPGSCRTTPCPCSHSHCPPGQFSGLDG